MPSTPAQSRAAWFFRAVCRFIRAARRFIRARARILGPLAVRAGRAALPWVRRFFPSLAAAALLFAFLLATGLADRMGETLARHTGPVPAALIVFGICFIPLLSTLTGPGLIIVLAAGILTGEQIAAAEASPFLALPVLLALDARLGGGFISPGLAFGEDEKETLNPGLPGIVFTRLMLLPAALAALCLFTFGF